MNEIEKIDKVAFDLNLLCCAWQNNHITYEDCRKAQQKIILQFAKEVAEAQKSACVQHYYDSDNKLGTLATIALTRLVTEQKEE